MVLPLSITQLTETNQQNRFIAITPDHDHDILIVYIDFFANLNLGLEVYPF